MEQEGISTLPFHSSANHWIWDSSLAELNMGTDLKVGVPYKFTLFDEPCVLFKRQEGKEPVCFVDRCPHRMAPLSQGVLMDTGEVMCAYFRSLANE
eukprot:scaffold132088_cov23-Prasinocladus_malaysianus.AAC.1